MHMHAPTDSPTPEWMALQDNAEDPEPPPPMLQIQAGLDSWGGVTVVSNYGAAAFLDESRRLPAECKLQWPSSVQYEDQDSGRGLKIVQELIQDRNWTAP